MLRNAETKGRITSIVLDHLSEVTLLTKDQIKLSDEVVKDLRVDGDDISFLLLPGIERDLGHGLTDEQWQRMRTVEDIITAFQDAMASNEKEFPKKGAKT